MLSMYFLSFEKHIPGTSLSPQKFPSCVFSDSPHPTPQRQPLFFFQLQIVFACIECHY